MGTITARTSKGGDVSYKAEIRIRRGGSIVHQETKTFEREQAAKAWMKKREVELDKPGALDAKLSDDPPLRDVIQKYIDESVKAIAGTKLSALCILRDGDLGAVRCSKLDSATLVKFAKAMELAPSTVAGYMSYLTTVFKIAKPAWGYPLDRGAILEAREVLNHLGVTGQSEKRDRRPTLDELDRIIEYVRRKYLWYRGAMPMDKVIAFAIFSTRRAGEILRLEWSHVDFERGRILVYNMKDPKKKIGNHVWVNVTQEALRILKSIPRTEELIFPYLVGSVSDSFKEACIECGVADLTFHDMRHEGVSRLFEMGYSIPEVSAMSGHKTWQNLKRYTHLQEMGDRYAGWKWLDIIAPLPQMTVK